MIYKFVVKQKNIYKMIQGKLTTDIITLICVENELTGMVLPHPISKFIQDQYANKSLSNNTQKRYAEELKKFLNFTIECVENEDLIYLPLVDKGLTGLRLEHGAVYISYLSDQVELENIKANYVFDIERILIKFYLWLNELSIIKEKITISYERRVVRGEIVNMPISPFNDYEFDVKYPLKENSNKVKERNLHDFGKGRLDLVNLFLKVAEIEAPDIALGIAFQFYGGVRVGEVVNLLRSSIKDPSGDRSNAFTLTIDDNWKRLFPNKRNTTFEQVKKPRVQAVFNVPILANLYQKHNKTLLFLEKQGRIIDKSALFCSYNNGKAISGTGYRNRFNKVKEKFLEVIHENSLDDYYFLKSKKWSTHIGRGIYTNILVFLLGWNASEVAMARGDSSIETAEAYIEDVNIIEKTIEATEILAISMLELDKYESLTIEDIRRN